MEYALPMILGAFGSFFVYKGAVLFVDHSASLARHWKVPLMIVGVTIVSIGTSLPELIVGILSGIENQNELVLGNVLGSNMANIGIVLGLSAFVYPVELSTVKKAPLELLAVLLSIVLLYAISLDGTLSRLDGVILIAGSVLFLGSAIQYYTNSAKELEAQTPHLPLHKQRDVVISLSIVFLGLILLLIGAHMIVTNAIHLARLFHLSELFIGVTLVAIGTSLPEIITSIIASMRKSNELVIGNVVGSNIVNILLILGITVFITPISVTANFWKVDIPLLFLATLILVYLIFTGKKIGKLYGILLLGIYGLYICITFVSEKI